MEIHEVNINEIVPDPNQPRTIIHEERVLGMARSIKTTGVINPVEIDVNKVLITGELRWRAAQVAGLQKIPAKILDIPPRERFLRQIIENIHTNTMTVSDTARALKKLVQDFGGINVVSRLIGKNPNFIKEFMGVLEEDLEVQEYLAAPDAKYSYIREINRFAPESFKSILKRKVTAGEIGDRETVDELIKALKRSPDKIDELLSLNLTGKMRENFHTIHQISPPVIPIERELEERDRAKYLVSRMLVMIRLMKEIGYITKEMKMEELELATLTHLKNTTAQMPEVLGVFYGLIDEVLRRKTQNRLEQE